MYKNAFKMKLKPGNREEYIKRHNEIWPELIEALKDAGINDYSIFLDPETDTLFAVQMLQNDFDAQALRELPIMKKWWAFMKDLMDVNSDNSPVVQSLEQVFHLD